MDGVEQQYGVGPAENWPVRNAHAALAPEPCFATGLPDLRDVPLGDIAKAASDGEAALEETLRRIAPADGFPGAARGRIVQLADLMVGIAEFIEARPAEREQIAKYAAATRSGRPGGNWKVDCRCPGAHADDCYERRVEGDNITIYDEGGHDEDQARHIALNDPTYVLADIAAKRKILAECDQILNGRREDGSYANHPTARHLARHTMWNLAASFAEHPDYESWLSPPT
jgi:hypothetical protein